MAGTRKNDNLYFIPVISFRIIPEKIEKLSEGAFADDHTKVLYRFLKVIFYV